MSGDVVGGNISLNHNTYGDGANNKALVAGAATTFAQGNGTFFWFYAPSVAADANQAFFERMRLDTNGNLGIGVIPEVWAGYKVVRLGQTAALLGLATGNEAGLNLNTYYDGTSSKAIVTGTGLGFNLHGITGFGWRIAPSIASGGTQAFIEHMTLSTKGGLSVTAMTSELPLALNCPGAQKPWVGAGLTAAQLGPRMHLVTGGNDAYLSYNAYFDGSTFRLIAADAASRVYLLGASLYFQHSGAAAADAAFGWVTRLQVYPNGTTYLIPNAGDAALWAQGTVGIGAGTPPAAWGVAALQVGATGALYDNAGYTQWANNLRHTGGAEVTLTTAASSKVYMQGGQLIFVNAPSATAGAAPAMANRMVISPNGSVSLYPDVAANTLITGGRMQLHSISEYILVNSGGTIFGPSVDNTQNLGFGSLRWTACFAVAGAINTSVYEAKEAFAPLDLAACAEAVLGTDWVAFAYRPPAYIAPEPPPDVAYDASDDNETKAEKKAQRDEAEARAKAAHVKMLAETQAVRRQKGYVLQSPEHTVHTLFGLEDRTSASPGSDLAVVACALQGALRDIADLKAQLAALAPQA